MSPTRILIADDEQSIRSLLRTFFAGEGYEIQEAANGQEALDGLTQDPPPDVVLLDLSMPAPQGMEVLERFRNMTVRPRPRVIVLTANGTVQRAVESLHMGAFDFIEKPCDPEKLLEAVERAMDQKILAEAATPEGCAAALARARRHLADGNLARAQGYLRATSRLAHHDPEYFYLMGLWHELSGHADEARDAYLKASEFHPQARDALSRLCAAGGAKVIRSSPC